MKPDAVEFHHLALIPPPRESPKAAYGGGERRECMAPYERGERMAPCERGECMAPCERGECMAPRECGECMAPYVEACTSPAASL